MKCKQVMTFFDRMYRERERFDRADVIAHLETCPDCRRHYARWSRIADGFGNAEPCEPPPYLSTRVMQAIADNQEKSLVRRFTGVFSGPTAVIAFAAVVIVVLSTTVFDGNRIQEQQSPAMAVIHDAQGAPALVHFEITLPDARDVALVGDFNSWNNETTQLKRKNATTWTVDLPLAKGSYQYLFLVDGTIWKDDPGRPQRIPDGFGGFNSVVEI